MGTAGEKAILEEMAKGVYLKSDAQSGTGSTWSATGMASVTTIAGSDTNKVLVGYVVFKNAHWCVAGSTQPYEWYFVKSQSSTSPDLTDQSVLENYMAEKRILARGWGMIRRLGIMAPEVHTERFFNITLEKGERLLYMTRILVNSTATDIFTWSSTELRKLTV